MKKKKSSFLVNAQKTSLLSPVAAKYLWRLERSVISNLSIPPVFRDFTSEISFPRSTLELLVIQAREMLLEKERNVSFRTSWFYFNLTDEIRLNVTFLDVEFVNASEIVREIDLNNEIVNNSIRIINDVYIARCSVMELSQNLKGRCQFIFTRSVLFGSMYLDGWILSIEPIKKSLQSEFFSSSLDVVDRYHYRITVQRSITLQGNLGNRQIKVNHFKTSTRSVSNIVSTASKTTLVVAAATGSFYSEWGSDLAAAMIYNIDGANEWNWIGEGSKYVPKDAKGVFEAYFGLSLKIKRIFYWPEGGPGDDPLYCPSSANSTADFIRNLSPSDPVFPFHIFILFTAKDLIGPGSPPYNDVEGCVVEIGNFKLVTSPSSIPTTESVPVAVVQSRSSDAGHLRRFTTAHEIGHILGGRHEKSGTVTLTKWIFFSYTGTRCDDYYDILVLYANTLMNEYSGVVMCSPFWTYSDFFISDENQQLMWSVINNAFQ